MISLPAASTLWLVLLTFYGIRFNAHLSFSQGSDILFLVHTLRDLGCNDWRFTNGRTAHSHNTKRDCTFYPGRHGMFGRNSSDLEEALFYHS